MQKLVSLMASLLGIILFSGCGNGFTTINTESPNLDSGDNLIVKGRIYLYVNMDKTSPFVKFIQDVFAPRVYAANSNVPVSVTVASNVQFVINSSGFSVPVVTTTDSLDFGNVAISSLRDNNLKICNPGGNTKCTQAILRVYTTGTAGAGLYNSAGGYGAPLTSQLGVMTPQTVGLNVANAAIMQTFTIPANKNTVRLSDFSATPTYNFVSDMTNAGSGSYNTTLVLEYGLQ